MDAIGFTVSIASLATLFQTAIECFQYIHHGKTFGIDFQTSSLQLSNARLRLSRWGETLGLNVQAHDMSSLEAALPARDLKLAEGLLGHIIYLFDRAGKISTKFDAERGKAGLGEAQDGLQARTLSLRQRMRDVCRIRQENITRAKKAEWALDKKDRLNHLVDTVSRLVADLVELFPATTSAQRPLSDPGAVNMRDEEARQSPEEITGKQGRLEKAGESDAARPSPLNAGTHYNTWKNSDFTIVTNQIGGPLTFYGDQNITM